MKLQASSITSLDRGLEFRSVAMDILLKLAADANDADRKHLGQLVVDAEKSCEHLDRQQGIPRHRLWPTKAGVTYQRARRAALRYLDLLCHLRIVHCFCQLRSQQFLHSAELLAASPVSDMPGLLKKTLAAKAAVDQSPAPNDIAQDIENSEADVDPLDKYMEEIDRAAKQAMAAMGTGEGGPRNGEAGTRSHETTANAEQSESDKLPPGTHRTAEAASAEERVAESAAAAAENKVPVCRGHSYARKVCQFFQGCSTTLLAEPTPGRSVFG